MTMELEHDPSVHDSHLNESWEIDKSDSDARLYWQEGYYAQFTPAEKAA